MFQLTFENLTVNRTVPLAEFGLTIDCIEHAESGNNLYKITDFHGSNYQEMLMAKSRKGKRD